MSLVLYEVHDLIAIITLNRPEVRNAVDAPTAQALTEVFQKFDRDEQVNVAVLTGANEIFCAGADLRGISEGRGNQVSWEGNGPLGPTRMLLSKPVLAAVEGYAVAGGLELALWCDLRVAAKNAVFGVFCRRWGVPLMDGGTVRLPRTLGHSHALDLILTGRGVSGEEAKMMGLANRLVEPGKALEKAKELARQIAQFPQKCMRNDRLSSYQQWELSFQKALSNETKLGMETICTGETFKGALNFANGKGRHGEFE